MSNSFLKIVHTLSVLGVFFIPFWSSVESIEPPPARFWLIQSIDTLKYSRDLSREKNNDPTFDSSIAEHIQKIAETGATHVAIGTPYDDEFGPILERWVKEARRHNLHIWFRGNWSGWEGWFGYPHIDRAQHLQQTEQFIKTHAALFEDGDIFTACPECENGGPGDPRRSGDIIGFRGFMVDEYQATQRVFTSINKKVQTNLNSMNGDVARLIMDAETTKAMGGLITLDHYVAQPQQLVRDIEDLHSKTGGDIVLGEFGAPIPTIHGYMTEQQQAAWIHEVLQELSTKPYVKGLNYWLDRGGSTALWSNDGHAHQAVGIIKEYFSPRLITGVIRDHHNQPLPEAHVRDMYRSTTTNTYGLFQLPYVPGSKTNLMAEGSGYQIAEIQVDNPDQAINITLLRNPRASWWKPIYNAIHWVFSS